MSKRGAATRVTYGRVVTPHLSNAWNAHGLTGDRLILASMEILRYSDLTPGPFADQSDSDPDQDRGVPAEDLVRAALTDLCAVPESRVLP